MWLKFDIPSIRNYVGESAANGERYGARAEANVAVGGERRLFRGGYRPPRDVRICCIYSLP